MGVTRALEPAKKWRLLVPFLVRQGIVKMNPRFLRVLVIVFIVDAGLMLVVGLALSILSFIYDIHPAIGPFLFLVGLVCLLIGIWRGKDILRGDTRTAN